MTKCSRKLSGGTDRRFLFSGINSLSEKCRKCIELSIDFIEKPDRQWRSSSFQESKKVRVSRDLWHWPWPWAHPDARWPGVHLVKVWWRSGHLPARRSDLRKSLQTDRRRTPRHCIRSFSEWANNKVWFLTFPFFFMVKLQNFLNALVRSYFGRHFIAAVGWSNVLLFFLKWVDIRVMIRENFLIIIMRFGAFWWILTASNNASVQHYRVYCRDGKEVQRTLTAWVRFGSVLCGFSSKHLLKATQVR